MKKRLQLCFILFIFLHFGSFKLSSQQVNSIYFLENIPARNLLNPAFQPVSDFYISLPVIGYTQVDISNNSVALNDLFYKQNGQTISFLENQNGINHFCRNCNQFLYFKLILKPIYCLLVEKQMILVGTFHLLKN